MEGVRRMFHSSYFSSEIPPECRYCRFGFFSCYGVHILCEKKGVVDPFSSCKKYRYAPLKRIPQRPKPLPQFDSGDFEL